jgi:hypothetical protein
MQNWRSKFRARYLEGLPARMEEVRIRERIEANRQEAIRRRIRSEILRAERERQARIERARELYPARFPSEVDEWNEEDTSDIVNVPNVQIGQGAYWEARNPGRRWPDTSPHRPSLYHHAIYEDYLDNMGNRFRYPQRSHVPRWVLRQLHTRGEEAQQRLRRQREMHLAYMPGSFGWRLARIRARRAYRRYHPY